jgi:hypothetical protein
VKSIIFLESCLVLATYRHSLSKIWRILTFFSSTYGEFFYVFPKNPLHKIRTGFSFGRQSAKTRQKEKKLMRNPSLYKFTKTEAELNRNGREAIDTS